MLCLATKTGDGKFVPMSEIVKVTEGSAAPSLGREQQRRVDELEADGAGRLRRVVPRAAPARPRAAREGRGRGRAEDRQERRDERALVGPGDRRARHRPALREQRHEDRDQHEDAAKND